MPTGVYQHKKGQGGTFVRSSKEIERLREIGKKYWFQKGHKTGIGNTYCLGKHWKIKDTSKMKGHIPWNKGKKGVQIGPYKGKKRPPFSKEWIKNIGEGHKGLKPTEETIEKIRIGNTGKKRTEEQNKKQSERMKGKYIGEKSSQWQGGKSFEKYGIDWTNDLKENIRQRDNYVCQLCGMHQNKLNGFYRKLDPHHVDYNKYNLNSENLITLCRSCHIKTNYNREYWIEYFQNKSHNK